MRTLTLLSMLCSITIAPALGQSRLVIEDVTLIDGTDGPPRHNVEVTVEGDRITRIAPVQHAVKLTGATVVDGRNKYLIPGLWNNDLHAFDYAHAKAALPSLLSYGITTVRDMGAPLDEIVRLRAEIRSQSVIGPRLFIAGPLMEGPVPVRMPFIVDLFDAAQARAEVGSLKQHGVDYIEVDTTLTPELYWAIAEEAQRQSLPLVGHIPPGIQAHELVKAHQVNVEHLGGRFLNILVACSREQFEFNEILAATYGNLLAALRDNRHGSEPQFTAPFGEKLLDTFDPGKAERLFRLYAQNRVAQTPTLYVLQTLWDTNREDQGLNAEDMKYGKEIFAQDMAVVRQMQRAGVLILAGTDGPYSEGGKALHEELALLVQAGLTPLQALQSATRNAADVMGAAQTSGTLEPGKTADMVLLDANPLDDIKNTQQVDAVVLRGKLLSKEQLTAMRPH
ncbi:MAG: amidohydrolase family protein [Terriglobia bacterium]